MSGRVAMLWRTYRRYGRRGAWALSRYYVEKVRASVSGPGRACPICGWSGPQFHPAVYPAHGLWRRHAACPRCASLERHRALWFAYRAFLASCHARPRVLHLSPERCFRALFQAHASRYVTGNYDHERADARLDLEHLGLADGSFDLIVANGVLSSVRDLAKAIDNLHRVLAPGGSALLCDLVKPDGVTRECADNLMAIRREFGGADLPRVFGPFTATLSDPRSLVAEADRERFGIRRDDFYLIRLDGRKDTPPPSNSAPRQA
ncbi:MAG: class I SAM-dependent methyltransferase [Acidobacteria bacterium]|nr:class I SAM-dependent methyltransferase [Acidobacteriota bacterium]